MSFHPSGSTAGRVAGPLRRWPGWLLPLSMLSLSGVVPVPAGDYLTLREATERALTDRERDVALEVGRGLSNAEIAKRLHLSVPTVKAHVSRLFDKLQCTNRVQIAIVVHDAGLI